MKIRNALPEDFPAAEEMEKEIFLLHRQNRPDFFRDQESPLSRERFEAMLQDPSQAILLAEEEGKAIGVCYLCERGYHDHPSLQDRIWIQVEDLVVKDGFQGKGVGTALMQAAKEYAVQQGIFHLELTVWGFNQNARRFYEKLGMRSRVDRLEIEL